MNNKIRNTETDILIIGGGPAGLTAARELTKAGKKVIVVEMLNRVGGISRTEDFEGYKLDIGGHRFFTKIPEVQSFWEEVMGDKFLVRPRLSRIFYNGKFFFYPIKLFDVIKKLGFFESLLVGISYFQAQLFPSREEENLEQWVSNRFGKRLFRMFFKTYTEKVWGIPCDEIKAEWAAQRIKGLTLWSAISNALGLGRKGSIKTLIEEFYYPPKGPGMLWETVQEKLEAVGNEVWLNAQVKQLTIENGKTTGGVIIADGTEFFVKADQVISTMPLRNLMNSLHPAPPVELLNQVNQLSYRDFLTVGLIIDQPELFPDNWIYIHSPEVQVGRIQNYKNWSPEMVPDDLQQTTCLGMEYFCLEEDELWNMDDRDLVRLAGEEIERIGLANHSDVMKGFVVRQPKAYPVYTGEYKAFLEEIRTFIDTVPNLQTIGRNGLHMYNNQDHSMLTAMLAVKNILGENHEIWDVNTERSYHEEVRIPG